MWTDTVSDSFRESGNLLDEITSLMQQVKYSKVNPLSFKTLIGFSPAVALFEGNPSITFYIFWKPAYLAHLQNYPQRTQNSHHCDEI